MDVFERRILKKRHSDLQENVEVTPDLLSSLRQVDAELLTEEMVSLIYDERSNAQKWNKLLEFLLQSQSEDVYSALCSALVTEDHAWMAKELHNEVEGDRGNLEIDSDVLKEAHMLVHRKFGRSKRFAEMDKKDIAELLATKVQVSKEEWKVELDVVRNQVTLTKRTLKERDNQTRDLDKLVIDFIKDNSEQLLSQAHGLRTTSDILRACPADDDLLSHLELRLKFLMARMHIVLEEKCLLQDEREKCFKVLGVKEDNIPLSDHLLLKITKVESADVVGRMKKEADRNEHTIKRQHKLMKEMENELEEKDQDVKVLKQQLAEKDEELKKVGELTTALKMELIAVREEMAHQSHGRRRARKNKEHPST